MKKLVLVCTLVAAVGAAPAGALTNYTDMAGYQAATGPDIVIQFTGLADATILSNQYAMWGVLFTDGDDEIWSHSYCTDGEGVRGNGRIHLTFTSMMGAVGAEFPGAMTIDLYNGDTLVGTSDDFGGTGYGFFGGISGVSFNKAVLRDWVDDKVYIDNLHFRTAGAAIPAPGAVLLVALGAGFVGWLRRRQSL